MLTILNGGQIAGGAPVFPPTLCLFVVPRTYLIGVLVVVVVVVEVGLGTVRLGYQSGRCSDRRLARLFGHWFCLRLGQ